MAKTSIAGAMTVVVLAGCAVGELAPPKTSAFENAGLRDDFKAPC